MPNNPEHIADSRSARFLMLGALAVLLEVDVPVWRHDSAAPQSCHDEAPPQ